MSTSDFLNKFGEAQEVKANPNKVKKQMMAERIKNFRLLKLFRKNRPGLLSKYNKHNI